MEQLLTATAEGSEGAFRELYRRSYDRLVGMAMAIMRDRGLAEDVAQEVFAEIWSRAGRFRPELGTAVPWMLSLTRCRAIDRIRSEESDRDRMLAAGARALTAVQAPVDERLEAEERATALTRALGRLSPLQREAIRVTHLDGATFREAAAALGIPVGTLKTRAHDGMLRLREILGAPAASDASRGAGAPGLTVPVVMSPDARMPDDAAPDVAVPDVAVPDVAAQEAAMALIPSRPLAPAA